MGISNWSAIIDSALIIAGISIWAYIIAFLHAFGYCNVFKIPVDFATLDKMEMVFPNTRILVPYLILLIGLLTLFQYSNIELLKHISENTKSPKMVIGIVLFSFVLAQYYGGYRANRMRDFFVLQCNPKLIVWYKSGDKLFCEKYDENQKKLTGEFKFINISEDIVLKKETLGDIKNSRKS